MADLVIAADTQAAMSDYPLMLQATGGDAAIDYTGPDVRQLLDVLAQEGVCGMGELRVTQRAAGTNLTVDIAAGRGFVKGDSVSRQGKFLFDSTGTINTGAAGNITVPGSGTRTHRVIARIRDKQAAGSTYGWSLEVLEDTGSGMPALPASAIDLASISVAAGTATITDAMITDRRSYACPSIPLDIRLLAADAASVLFDGIPGFIKGLELTWSARCTGAAPSFALGGRINGDTVTNYGRAFCSTVNNGTATPTFSTTADVTSYMRLGVIPGTGTSAGLFADGRAVFPRWSIDGASTRVRAIHECAWWESLNNGRYETGSSYWIGTAAPKSLTLVPLGGSLLTGSQFILKAIA